jgi:ribosome-associated protein
VARHRKYQFDPEADQAKTDQATGSLEETEEVSKSQLKREALSKRSLASELIALGNKQFADAPLDEDLRDEIRDARKITSHVARKRQLMYVGKKLRLLDTSEIEQYLENLKNNASQLTQKHHNAESWRDYLLANGDQGLAEFLHLRPDADRQALRQLIRNAGNEMKKGKPPTSARALFRMLREMDSPSPLPSGPV